MLYPKRPSKKLFENLVSQCVALNIPFEEKEISKDSLNKNYDVLLDGILVSRTYERVNMKNSRASRSNTA